MGLEAVLPGDRLLRRRRGAAQPGQPLPAQVPGRRRGQARVGPAGGDGLPGAAPGAVVRRGDPHLVGHQRPGPPRRPPRRQAPHPVEPALLRPSPRTALGVLRQRDHWPDHRPARAEHRRHLRADPGHGQQLRRLLPHQRVHLGDPRSLLAVRGLAVGPAVSPLHRVDHDHQPQLAGEAGGDQPGQRLRQRALCRGDQQHPSGEVLRPRANRSGDLRPHPPLDRGQDEGAVEAVAPLRRVAGSELEPDLLRHLRESSSGRRSTARLVRSSSRSARSC